MNYNTVHKVYQDLEADGLINSGRGKRSTIADIDHGSIEAPGSPVDMVIDELLRVARECNVSREDLEMRLLERLSEWTA